MWRYKQVCTELGGLLVALIKRNEVCGQLFYFCAIFKYVIFYLARSLKFSYKIDVNLKINT